MDWKGFRTFFHAGWVSAAGMMLIAKDQLSFWGVDIKAMVGEYVPAQDVGVVMVALAGLFAYMRMITTTPPFQPSADATPPEPTPDDPL